MKSIVLFLRALLFFALATSLAAGKPVPFIPLVEEDPGYLIQYSGLDVGWTWVPPDQVTYYSSIYTHPDLPDAVSNFFFLSYLCSCGFDKLDDRPILMLRLIRIHNHLSSTSKFTSTLSMIKCTFNLVGEKATIPINTRCLN